MTINRDFFQFAPVSIVIKKLFGKLSDQIDENLGIEGVTASAAELNILDGATLSTAELNILDGVTATATEINLLDGLPTVDPADGVTVWNDAGVLKVASPA